MMVESEAKELSEEIMLGAVLFAHDACREIVKAIVKLAEQAAKDPWEMASSGRQCRLKDKLKKLIGKDIAAAYKLTDKSARSNALNEARAKAKAKFADGLSAAGRHGRHQADQEAGSRDRPHRHPQGRQAHRRPHDHADPSDRGGSRTSCRARTARRCSPAAKPRRSRPARWAPATPSR
jgi:hypothetical protein